MNNLPEVTKSGESRVNAAHDAVLLSMSAFAYMVNVRYQIWRNYRILSHSDKFSESERRDYAEWAKRDGEIVIEACRMLDAAMQFIGNCNNNNDAVDNYGNTDAAFMALDRAFDRDIPQEGDEE